MNLDEKVAILGTEEAIGVILAAEEAPAGMYAVAPYFWCIEIP